MSGDKNGLNSALNAVANQNTGENPEFLNRTIDDCVAYKKVLETRRSVRIFDRMPIDPKVMNEIIDLSMLAPSSSNLQPWEFHWVRSKDKRMALEQACLSQPAAKTAGELVVIVARTGTWRRNINIMLQTFSDRGSNVPEAVIYYYKRLVPAALSVGPLSVLAPFKWAVTRILRYSKPTPQEPLGAGGLRIWAHKSVALAAQTFMLSARAYNLDTCPMEGFDSWRVKSLLNLPSDAEISMVIAVGKALPQGIYGGRLRFDRKLFVFEH
ncbi:MAG: nitroreductase family protein [Proteobacteria bacterium]|nr:nitroreductase family protein [Pseudomonadota bacterium]